MESRDWDVWVWPASGENSHSSVLAALTRAAWGWKTGAFRNLHNHPQSKFDLLAQPAVLGAVSKLRKSLSELCYCRLVRFRCAISRRTFSMRSDIALLRDWTFFLAFSRVQKEKKNSYHCFAVFLHTLSAVRVSFEPTGDAAEIGWRSNFWEIIEFISLDGMTCPKPRCAALSRHVISLFH